MKNMKNESWLPFFLKFRILKITRGIEIQIQVFGELLINALFSFSLNSKARILAR